MHFGYLQALRLHKENVCLICETGEWVSSGLNPVKKFYLIKKTVCLCGLPQTYHYETEEVLQSIEIKLLN